MQEKREEVRDALPISRSARDTERKEKQMLEGGIWRRKNDIRYMRCRDMWKAFVRLPVRSGRTCWVGARVLNPSRWDHAGEFLHLEREIDQAKPSIIWAI